MIKMVALLGMGAVGSIYARILDKKTPPGGFYVIMDEERARRCRNGGYTVNNRPFTPPCLAPDAGDGTADLLLVCLKYRDLAAALAAARSHVGPATQILLPLNGLASEAIAADLFGWERVLYSIAVGVDSSRDREAVTVRSPGTLCFGEAVNNGASARVAAIRAFFDAVGIANRVPDDMLRLLWWKLMVNVGINQVAAVLNAPYAAFQREGHARELMIAAQRETVAVAAAAGVRLGEADIQEWLAQLAVLSAEGCPSTLQDLRMGRKTEVDYLGGSVVGAGEKYGVATPVNRMLVSLVHAVEEVRGAV